MAPTMPVITKHIPETLKSDRIETQKNIRDQLNRPLHDLRISVIDRCNFRCTYCMPAEKFNEKYTFLHKEEWLSFDELARLVNLFVKLGVSKVRLTGGEPLLRENLDSL